jgi:chloramphenicol-sensitive protein RarD
MHGVSVPRTARMNHRTEPDPAAASSSFRSGLIACVCAFLMWGIFPLYLRALASVPPGQILAHRIVWSTLLVFAWLALRRELRKVGAALLNRPVCSRLAASATLISVNWLIYVWGVNNGHVIDASLGYFINPLVSVLLGVMVLHERLNRAQWTAVALAALGVAYLTIVVGRPPWIAAGLAASFGMYGLIRKITPVEAVPGLAVETLLLTPIAAAYLFWCSRSGTAAFGQQALSIDLLLIGSGLATAVPLALFSYGARLIPLSTVGLIQYIGPSLQLVLGITVFGEPFPAVRAWGFALIWLALAIYMGDSFLRSRRTGYASA